MSSVKTLIITGFGLNCEKETSAAFETAGSEVSRIHLNDLLEEPTKLDEFQILAFIGGFSFGDHLGAGTVFSNRVKYGLKQQLEEFIDAGKLIIGICNGFQTITRMGIVPAIDGLFKQDVALQHNDSGVFRDSWVTLKINAESPCIFTQGIDLLPVPIRHGEGKFVPMNDEVLTQLEEGGYVAVRYADPVSGEQTSGFPLNPNGSVNDIAGICDKSGRVFGLMPHPEAYLSPFNHPHWTHQKINGTLPAEGLGMKMFRNAVNFAKENLV
jgi:phosphoribosylformylglycinamidine synthase subunit PurQ / glutaminase